MRMWMVDVKKMCRKHLLGEHNEIHKHRHVFIKHQSIKGRVGQIEPKSMETRHNELAEEMVRRGYHHMSPYVQPDMSYYVNEMSWEVDVENNIKDLTNRCPECKKMFEV